MLPHAQSVPVVAKGGIPSSDAASSSTSSPSSSLSSSFLFTPRPPPVVPDNVAVVKPSGEYPSATPSSSSSPSFFPLFPPVVAEGALTWGSTEERKKEEGQSVGVGEGEEVNVLGLLQRLHLNKFGQLVEQAGLTLTLSLDGR